LPEDSGPYSDEVYKKASQNLKKMQREGVLIQEDQESFYLYQQEIQGRRQTGLVVLASVDDYENNVIKKHELTRADKEEDRVRHVEECMANTGPVFLTYKKNEAIVDIVSGQINRAPLFDFQTEDNVSHRFWTLRDKEIIKRLQDEFEKVESLYVADGHHRSAAAARVGKKLRDETGDKKYGYFLSVLFCDEELKIMAYNRIVADSNNHSSIELLGLISKNFAVREIKERQFEPESRHQFGLYLDGKWFELTANADLINEADPVKSLDVSLLQEYILSPFLGIGDPRLDSRIEFVGGIHGAKGLVERCEQRAGTIAFSLYPTSIAELLNVADHDLLMPPKSTWFEPKLRSGLIISTYPDY